MTTEERLKDEGDKQPRPIEKHRALMLFGAGWFWLSISAAMAVAAWAMLAVLGAGCVILAAVDHFSEREL